MKSKKMKRGRRVPKAPFLTWSPLLGTEPGSVDVREPVRVWYVSDVPSGQPKTIISMPGLDYLMVVDCGPEQGRLLVAEAIGDLEIMHGRPIELVATYGTEGLAELDCR